MERLLAVELQAQGHLRKCAENTVPDGLWHTPFLTNFIAEPFLSFVVRQAGWGDGPFQGGGLQARARALAPSCRPA